MRELIACDTCGKHVGTMLNITGNSDLVPPHLRGLLGLVPGGLSSVIQTLKTNLVRCASCSLTYPD